MSENTSNTLKSVCLICGQVLPSSSTGAMCRTCASARRAARNNEPGGPSKMAVPPVQLPGPGGPSKMAVPPVQLPGVAPPSGMHRPVSVAPVASVASAAGPQPPTVRKPLPTPSDSQDNLSALSQSRLPTVPRIVSPAKCSAGSSSRVGSMSSPEAPTGGPGTSSSTRTQGVPGDSSVSTAPLRAGSAPPGYQILGELGRGGMGVVYKARDTRLGRLVALKMLLAGGHVSAATRRRFRTEGEAVARLDHPGIVQIYEVGEHEGLPYFALEYLAGGSLDQKLNGRPMPSEAAAELTETIARAVFAAHQSGLIHRDIKPGNILLTEDGRAKLTDFGLAKQVGDSTGDGSSDAAPIGAGMTATGAMMGTPSYMAPEQVEGGRHVGPAADIYALGAVLYQLLTGRPPFLGDTEIHTVYQVMTQEPVPVTRLQPRVPADLETICLKCLAKEPARRYATAEELADDLKRFLSAEPIIARPAGWLERTVKWVRRKPATAGLVAVSLLAAVVLVVVGITVSQKLAAKNADLQSERDKLAERGAELEREKKNVEEALKSVQEARQLADRNAFETDQERQAAKEAEAQARRLNVQLLIEKGVALCSRGDVDVGLHWLGRALESLDPKDPKSARLESTIRTLLGGWATELPVPSVLLRHDGPVTKLALDPLGRWVVAGTHHAVPIVRELPNGRRLPHALGSKLRLSAVAVNRDGTVLATCSSEKFLRFWDAGSILRGARPKLDAPNAPPPRLDGARPPAMKLSTAVGDSRGASSPAAPAPAAPAPAAPAPAAPAPAIDPVESDATVTATPLGSSLALPTVAITVALSADGKTAVTGHEDQTVRLWDVATRSPRGGPIKLPSLPIALAFSPDARILAVAAGIQVSLHRVADLRRCGEPIENEFGISSLDFSPGGRLLVTGCSDNAARVWDIGPIVDGLDSLPATPPAPAQPAPHQPAPHQPAPDQLIVPDGLRGRLPSALAVGQPSRHRYIITAVAFHPLGDHFLTGSSDATIRLWRARDGLPDSEFVRHQGRVHAVAFTRDGRWAATASEDGGIRLWRDLGNLHQRQSILHHAELRALAQSPDGTRLAIGAVDGFCAVRDVASGKPINQPLLLPKGVYCLAFSRDGATFATGCDDYRVRLYETSTGNPVGQHMVHKDRVTGIVFLPNGLQLATACFDGQVRLWNVRTGQSLNLSVQTGDPHNELIPAPAHGLSVDPSGHHLLIGSWNRTARLWSLDRLQATGPVLRHLGGVSGTAFSPNGCTLLTVGWDMTARLWSTAGQRLGEIMRHEGVVYAGNFSPDGRLVATASWDGTVRLWDATTGYPVGRPFWHGERGFAVEFSQTGKSLAAIAGRQLIHWSVPDSYTGNLRSLRPWLELHTGLELLPNGNVSELSTHTWLHRHREAFPEAYKADHE